MGYLPDYGVTFFAECISCGCRLCAVDIPVQGRYPAVVPANAVYRPGIPTLHCIACENKFLGRSIAVTITIPANTIKAGEVIVLWGRE